MKRKMIGAAAAYMSGLFFASFFITPGGLSILLAGAVGLILALHRRLISSRDIILLLGVFTIAVGVYTAADYNAEKLVKTYSGKQCSFSGEVTDITLHSGGKASYVLTGTASGRKVKVSIYTNDLDAAYGDIITAESCILTPPESSYLFDSESWYRSQHIFLTLEQAKGIAIHRQSARPLKNALMEFRQRTIHRFCDTLGMECGGFLSGMVFGEKGGIGQGDRISLYRCGIGHILAVSGLHISVAASAIIWLMRRAGAGRSAAFIVADLFMLLLISLAQYPVSAIRAAVMMNLIFGAWLLRRIPDLPNSLAIASLIICLCDPMAVHSAGFMLSLSGTFAIGVFAPYMTRDITNRFALSLATGFWAMLAIMPVSMLYFSETSILSPFTNLLLVPMCTLAMIAGLLSLISFGALDVLLIPAGFLLQAVLSISRKLSGFSVFLTGFDSRIRIIALGLGSAVVMLYLFTRSRKALLSMITAAVIVLCTVSAVSMYDYRKGFSAAFPGTAKTCAVVVIYDGMCIVADFSGKKNSADYAAAYLSECGITYVDMVILMKNANSQLAAYDKAFSGVHAGKWFVRTETACIGSNQNIITLCGSAEISAGGLSVHVSDGETAFSAEGRTFTLTAGKSGTVTAAFTYGSTGRYIDDVPGQCLRSGNDGTLTIRRL